MILSSGETTGCSENSKFRKYVLKLAGNRSGHDRRYAINCDKLKNEPCWKQAYDFDKGLDLTIDWYMSNDEWTIRVRSGENRKWIGKNYGERRNPMDIEILKKEIVARLNPLKPEKIILFGSYAWGNPGKYSDIDLYVVTNDDYMPRNWEEKSGVYLKVLERIDDLQNDVPVDVIAHTRPMHKRFIDMGSTFSKKIMRDGISLL